MWDETLGPLLDALPVGVIVVDRGGMPLSMNSPARDLLGLDSVGLGDRSLSETIAQPELSRAFSTPPNGSVRIEFKHGDRILSAEVRENPAGGGVTKLAILTDVTEISRAALMRKNMIFDLLHRLRTPLTTIVSVLSLATSGRLDAHRMDFGDVMGMGVKEAERLTGLLDTLRELFLIESGALSEELAIEPLAPDAVLSEAVESIREALRKKDQELVEQYSVGIGEVLADRVALRRVFVEILKNASRYTPEGGLIQLSTQQLSDHVRIQVLDNGPGIPEEDLPMVFHRFWRGRSPAVRGVEGEGLGLHLARGLLSAQNGTILIDSEPEVGTSVEITLVGTESDA